MAAGWGNCMSILMTGIDYNKASLETRERFALTIAAQEQLLEDVCRSAGVLGSVLISTCNRMELWVSGEAVQPYPLLCSLLGVDERLYEPYFTTREEDEAVDHLFELACGLKSQIFGEEQILSQVKDSIAFARECGASDPVLEALFRCAVTAAKKAKTAVHLSSVDRSAARSAVQLLQSKFERLQGLRCLVIGSGEMGRLAAKELLAEGCEVTMTLRRYKHGKSVIPAGCRVVDYEDRHSELAQSQVIFSATRSPHYTLICSEAKTQLAGQGKILFDLAVPRDIDPEIAGLPGVCVYDIDHLGCVQMTEQDSESIRQVRAIVEEELLEFRRWLRVRALMPKINEISAAAATEVQGRMDNRLKNTQLCEEDLRLVREAAGQAVEKVVSAVLLDLQKRSESKQPIPEPILAQPETQPVSLAPRFPLFVDLTDKQIVVIGAGPIALRRIQSLNAYPCTIRVVAPKAVEEIHSLHRQGKLTYIPRAYEPEDLRDAYLVIAATGERELNHEIAEQAQQNKQYCSVADCKEECTFYFPATIHYPGGVIGVCGTGENHRKTKEVAAGIREFMADAVNRGKA